MTTDAEIWEPIEEYPDYLISSYGRCLSLKGINPRILKPQIDTNGYHIVTLYKDSKAKTVRIARLVAAAFIPNPENKPQINHIDGNKNNNQVTNLEWVTGSENNKHANKTGLANGATRKITSAQAIEIFQKFHSGKYTQVYLAKQYSLSRRAVQLITHGRTWAKYTKNLLFQNQAEKQPILA